MKKLLIPQIKPATYRRNEWRITPPQGTKIDEVTNKDFWSHVTKRIQAGDLVEVLPEGNEWFAVLLVLAVDAVSAKVKVLQYYELTDAKTAEAPTSKADATLTEDPFYIKFRGPKNQWCVLRTKDHEVVKEGLTKDQAAAEAETLKLAA